MGGRARFPRRCGDVPALSIAIGLILLVPPQVRGCPCEGQVKHCGPQGSPAGAGMSPRSASTPARTAGFPRRCGDVPAAAAAINTAKKVPPQVRGCPRDSLRTGDTGVGSPAGAGMSPTPAGIAPTPHGFPRRCGDVPLRRPKRWLPKAVPPQVRGCPPFCGGWVMIGCGSPAGAGMSLEGKASVLATIGFPRRCGDVPKAVGAVAGGAMVPRRCGDVPPRSSPALDQVPVPRRCGDVPGRSQAGRIR